ncbi:MAG TPA: hypothetical protein VEA69_05745 [Tepidisphaeraceae bacterium]|nr:hypothetical protein [Tepidisphaeraceae bacterium]
MPRLLRIILNTATAVLVLFFGCLALRCLLDDETNGGRYIVHLGREEVGRPPTEAQRKADRKASGRLRSTYTPTAELLGLEWGVEALPYSDAYPGSTLVTFDRTLRIVPGFPWAALGVVVAFRAAFYLPALIRLCRRPRAGHCAACGYDLRASPHACPECGTPAPNVA